MKPCGSAQRVGRNSEAYSVIGLAAAVIASGAKQSRAARIALDCFVASLLAMTSGNGSLLHHGPDEPLRVGPELPHQAEMIRVLDSDRPEAVFAKLPQARVSVCLQYGRGGRHDDLALFR